MPCVSRLLLLCVQQHGQIVSCVLFGRNICPVLTLDWVIFLQLGFLCDAVCLHVLAWHCSNAVTATFSILRLSLPAPRKKRMGEDRRGAELWGFSRNMDLQHISNQEELVCFLPFFYICRFGEIQGILKCPTMFLILPSEHKNVFIPITPLLFSIQGLQFRVIQDSLNYVPSSHTWVISQQCCIWPSQIINWVYL